MNEPLVALASSSPRRRELLAQIGLAYRTVDVRVDEGRRAGEPPADYVRRLALAKARAGAASAGLPPGLPVLGADTAVVLDGDLLGKPAGEAEALAMLARLSGRTHRVLTGVALVGRGEHWRISESVVTFRPIGEAERLAYWRSGEPADKAGAYAIQGRGALFVARIEGSYSGIVGLPLHETAELLAAQGITPAWMRG
jgi:septum formation protein